MRVLEAVEYQRRIARCRHCGTQHMERGSACAYVSVIDAILNVD